MNEQWFDVETGKPVEPVQLTVKNLIACLSKFNPDALVEIEGCDCNGEAMGVEYDHEWDNKTLAYERVETKVRITR